MLEENYTCWYEGQSEEDGRNVIASSLQEAARKAVDIWRHENIRELTGDAPFIVYLKDEDGYVHKVNIRRGPEPSGPEAST